MTSEAPAHSEELCCSARLGNGLRWRGSDVNILRCCGLEVLEIGSRDGPFIAFKIQRRFIGMTISKHRTAECIIAIFIYYF